jgi:Kef-type K+ transport system membrane component KefB
VPESRPRRSNRCPAHPAASEGFLAGATSALFQNSASGLSRLFLQLFVIIVVSSIFGGLFRRIGQPAVVGEMMAGILLGPSLLGWVAPHAFAFLFAASTLEPLRLLSQIGVCLFMFAVGMELDVSQLKRQMQTAIVVSHSSIVIPYLLGVALALFLYSSLAHSGASFTAFALFMGISMSITAFPVLVRILKDRRLFQTSLGTTATACAAVDDVTAWTILAFVVAIARAANLSAATFSFAPRPPLRRFDARTR